VLISNPPDPTIAKLILERVGKSGKAFTICFLGLGEFELPANAVCAADLRVAAEQAMSGKKIEWVVRPPNPAALAFVIGGARAKVQGLFRRDFMRRYSFVAPACQRHQACVTTRTFCSIWANTSTRWAPASHDRS
jgi:hypothetical protein